MAFKPNKGSGGNYSGTPRNFPVPEAGNHGARLSLIIDLGRQQREDFEDKKTGETKPQEPCHQIALFADLTDQVVDYGGDIGEAPYRIALNKSFKGELSGINFQTVPYKDGEGKVISSNKPWTYHPANILSKIAKAVGNTKMLSPATDDDLDIEALLDKPMMVEVEVKVNDTGKKDDNGDPIVYKNVSAKGYSTVPKVKGVAIDVEPLRLEPLVITFDNVTAETAKFIRADVRRKIQKALNYEGSQMQKVLAELANQQSQAGTEGSDDQPEKQESKGDTPTKTTRQPTRRAPEKPADAAAIGNEDLPF